MKKTLHYLRITNHTTSNNKTGTTLSLFLGGFDCHVSRELDQACCHLLLTSPMQFFTASHKTYREKTPLL